MSAKAYVKVTTGLWKSVNKVYVKVTPTLWKSVNKIYVKVTNTLWKSSFGGSDEPVQITKPTLTGTGRVGTTVTRSSGTYSNYNSLITRIFYTTEVAEQVSASTVDPSGGNTTATNPYTILQSDATEPPYYFYARDEVLGVDNETYYYYSTPPIQANISQLEDNFNRTVASGLGTASGGYIYSGPFRNTTSWSVNGSKAVNNSNGSGYPLQSVNINTSNQNVSVDTFGGGLGVAVWVDSANSWWAAIPEYSYLQEGAIDYNCDSDYTYVPEGEDCPPAASLGSNPQSSGYTYSDVGLRCSACYEQTTTETTYPCTGVGSSRFGCPDTGPLSGDRCGACYQGNGYIECTDYISGQTSCPPEGENAGQRCSTCVSSVIQTTSCNTNNTGTCPGSPTGGQGIGDQCTSCQTETDSYYVCDDYVTGQASCNQCAGACTPSTSTSYPCTGSTSSASCPETGPLGGDRCGGCVPSTTTTYPCNVYVTGRTSTGGTGTNVGDRCSSATSSTNTTYPCTGSVSNSTSCPDIGALAGDRCGACSSTGGTTYGSCRLNSAGSPNCPSCPGGTTSIAQYNCATGQSQCRCVIPIRYSYSVRQTATSTVYSYYTIGQETSTTNTYAIRNTVSTTTYSYYTERRVTVSYSSWLTRGAINATVYAYNKWEQKYETAFPIRVESISTVTTKYYKKVSEVDTTQYTYNANISIYSYSSGSFSLQSSAVVSSYAASAGSQFNEGLYPTITSVSAVTSGNNINATGYINTYSNSTSATNSGTKGSSVGVVSLPAVQKIGNQLDNFSA